MKVNLLFICLVIYMLTSCTSIVRFDNPDSKHPLYSEAKLDVAPDKKLLILKETSSSWGIESHYEVGALVKRIFNEKTTSSNKIELQHHELILTSTDVLFFGTRWNASFSIMATLTNGNKKEIINVIGNGTSMSDPSIAGMQAIENAFIKIHKLVTHYLESWH